MLATPVGRWVVATEASCGRHADGGEEAVQDAVTEALYEAVVQLVTGRSCRR